jgi:2-polyprenyl-3-methyl-5-hydroxy-6-metoxy-1,4-benzoquinol methylase
MNQLVEKYFNFRNQEEKKLDLKKKHLRTLNIINKLLIFNKLKIIDNKKKILDVGCGDGSLVKYLKSRGIFADGCDIKDLDFEKDHFSFKKETFDFILLYSVIEHINNTSHLMLEIKRMLKKSGILIIITPNFKYCFNSFYDDPTHVKPFTNLGLENMLKIYNFKNILVKPWTSNYLNFIWKLPFCFFYCAFFLLFRNDTKYFIPRFLKGKSTTMISVCNK